MSDIDYRPDWCGCPDNKCIISRAGVFCMGILDKSERHDKLLDNVCFCMAQQDDGKKTESPDPDWLNLEDLILIKREVLDAIQYILANNLYKPPGFGDDYGREEAREWEEKCRKQP
jgi:hypothetical protein